MPPTQHTCMQSRATPPHPTPGHIDAHFLSPACQIAAQCPLGAYNFPAWWLTAETAGFHSQWAMTGQITHQPWHERERDGGREGRGERRRDRNYPRPDRQTEDNTIGEKKDASVCLCVCAFVHPWVCLRGCVSLCVFVCSSEHAWVCMCTLLSFCLHFRNDNHSIINLSAGRHDTLTTWSSHLTLGPTNTKRINLNKTQGCLAWTEYWY